MQPLPYLSGYPAGTTDAVRRLLAEDRLGVWLLERYPRCHPHRSGKALHAYAQELKNRFMRQSPPLRKVVYDPRLDVIHNALGIHHRISRVHGSRVSTRNEIRVATVFRVAPQAFLDMILIHELAHLKVAEHNRAFYRLCLHMDPDYHRRELEARIYLTYVDCVGGLY